VIPIAVTLDPLHFPCDFEVLGIPHFWNVVTNVPFTVLGVLGLLRLSRDAGGRPEARRGWTAVWISTALLGPASGIYHWTPTIATLALDRVFVTAVAASIAYRAILVSRPVANPTLLLVLVMAACQSTVLIWLLGASPIPYGLLQLALAIYVLTVYARLSKAAGGSLSLSPLIGLVALYALAKLCELGDELVCEQTGCIGGHPFKHLFGAAGLAFLIPFQRREIAVVTPTPTAT
jgi:hypothetical protein